MKVCGSCEQEREDFEKHSRICNSCRYEIRKCRQCEEWKEPKKFGKGRLQCYACESRKNCERLTPEQREERLNKKRAYTKKRRANTEHRKAHNARTLAYIKKKREEEGIYFKINKEFNRDRNRAKGISMEEVAHRYFSNKLRSAIHADASVGAVIPSYYENVYLPRHGNAHKRDPKKQLISVLNRIVKSKLAEGGDATDAEVMAWYQEHDKVWKNPRITVAERFRLRYNLDEEFKTKEKERSRAQRLLNKKQPVNSYQERRYQRQEVQSDCSVTQSTIYKILSSRKTCHYCGERLTKENRSLDHMQPLAKGGLHSVANLTVCCRACNAKKNNKDFLAWLQLLEPRYAESALNYYQTKQGDPLQMSLFEPAS